MGNARGLIISSKYRQCILTRIYKQLTSEAHEPFAVAHQFSVEENSVALIDSSDANQARLALSLDFPEAPLHDAFRGVAGAFEKTMRAVSWAHEAGLPLQINTTVCAETVPYLERMASFVETLGIVFWEVFFLVPTGRGTDLAGLRAEECERVFALLHRVQEKGSFIVKVTEAPH